MATVPKEVPNVKAISPNITFTQPGGNVTLRCHVINAYSADVMPLWRFYPDCTRNITNYQEYIPPRQMWEGSKTNLSFHLVNISQTNLGCYECCVQDLQDDWLAEGEPIRRCQTLFMTFIRSGKIWIHFLFATSWNLTFILIYCYKK